MVRLLSVLFVLALSSSASAQMLDTYPEISAIEREAAAQIAVKSPNLLLSTLKASAARRAPSVFGRRSAS